MTITAQDLQKELNLDARTFYRLLGYMGWEEASQSRQKEFSNEQAKEIRFANQLRTSDKQGVQKVKEHFQGSQQRQQKDSTQKPGGSAAGYDPTDPNQNPFYDLAYQTVRQQQKVAFDMAYFAVLNDGSFFEDMMDSAEKYAEIRQQQINAYAKEFNPPPLNIEGKPVDLFTLEEAEDEDPADPMLDDDDLWDSNTDEAVAESDDEIQDAED